MNKETLKRIVGCMVLFCIMFTLHKLPFDSISAAVTYDDIKSFVEAPDKA